MRKRRPAESPIVVVGLGNPGDQYAGTRHNVGEEVAHILAAPGGLGKAPRRVQARIARIELAGRPVLVAVPTTYMNRSGEAVASVLSYHKIGPDRLVVVHDDIDLPFARMRLHRGRGSGGNNGVASIIRSLRTSDFWRLRLGVGRPPQGVDPADYVLRRFSKQERSLVDLLIREAADVVEVFVAAGDEAAKQSAAEATKRLASEA